MIAYSPRRSVCGKGTANRRLRDRKSTRLNSSHVAISYAVFCLKKKKRKVLKCIEDARKTLSLAHREASFLAGFQVESYSTIFFIMDALIVRQHLPYVQDESHVA